jgi:hypothetical protein
VKSIADQVHTHFRVFAGKAQKVNPIAGVARKAEAWVAAEKISPKSIGVEYLEATREVILTIGYRRGATPYEISLVAQSLGVLADTKRATIAALESQMQLAAAKLKNVICHELLVTEKREFIMVFMTHR